MTDRGTKLSRTEESLLRARKQLARNLGNLTEQDWRKTVARYEERIQALREEK